MQTYIILYGRIIESYKLERQSGYYNEYLRLNNYFTKSIYDISLIELGPKN
jgi:hypothetical protein